MRRPIGRLARDPILIVGFCMSGLTAAVLCLPGIAASTREAFVLHFSDLIFLVPVAGSMLLGTRRTEHPEERLFWRLLGIAFATWSLVKILENVVPYEQWGVGFSLTSDLCYQAFYGLVLMALFTYPHRRGGWSRGDVRFGVEATGAVLFSGGLYAYFVLVPAALDRTAYDSLEPSMILYITMDIAVAIIAARHLRCAQGARWRMLYGLLAVGFTLILLSDVAETLMLMDVLPWFDTGHPIDALWALPYLPILAAARARHLELQQDVPGVLRTGNPKLRRAQVFRGPLPLFAAALPLLHFGLYAAGMLDPFSQDAREILAIILLVILGTASIAYQGLLELQHQKTRRENACLAAFPVQSPNPILTCTSEGALTYANPAAEALVGDLGITLEEFLPEFHPLVSAECFRTRRGFTELEHTICERVLSFSYTPNEEIDAVHIFITDITGQKAVELQLVHNAQHDPLTSLPNRILFLDRLQQAVRRTGIDSDFRFALLFLDLNRFKFVNDSYGHLLGDQLLHAIAERLQSMLRPEDLLARLGGDEFAVLIEGLRDDAVAAQVARRVDEAFKEPFDLGEQEIYSTASIGITFSSSERTSPEDYLQDADIAMYRAKGAGKTSWVVFDRDMRHAAMRQMRLDTELSRALERNEFVLHYQPVVSLADGKLHSFEALLRWDHPSEGLLLPAEFLESAEESGLIVTIGQQIIESACATLVDWQQQSPQLEPVAISVNLSARQLERRGFADDVARAVESSGVDPRFLAFEITEAAMMQRDPSPIDTLERLANLGCPLVLDDFGTGFSSLETLQRVPIEVLKIDRALVQGLEASNSNLEIVRAIIGLAQNLGMQPVAEGVEGSTQSERLSELGCHLAQGYFFARPMPIDEATDVVARRNVGVPAQAHRAVS